MQMRLEKILSALTLFTALAYSLGWIKTSYYFQTFGIGLSSLGFSPQDYLFESWFVLENLVFFLLLSWTVILSRRWWAYAVGVFYLVLPYLSDLAFQYWDRTLAKFLVEHRHSLLKFVPFLLLRSLLLCFGMEESSRMEEARPILATGLAVHETMGRGLCARDSCVVCLRRQALWQLRREACFK